MDIAGGSIILLPGDIIRFFASSEKFLRERTDEAEIMRSSNGSPSADLVLKQVAGRRYSATPAVEEKEGFYKVERLTRRSSIARRNAAI